MLTLSNIRKSFSGVEVLHGVSFDISEGCVTALVGENGAGKSTLVNIISGVYTDYSGEMVLDGQRVSFRNPRDAERAGISIIHQELSCIPDLTVGENILLGREPLRYAAFIDFPRLFEATQSTLKEFDFPYSSRVKARTISVGWQQIVEIARAFSTDAKIIILDEPTSALTKNEIRILFEKIRLLRERGKTILFISHRLEEVFEIADQVLVLRDGGFVGRSECKAISRARLISMMVGKDISEAQGDLTPAQNAVALSLRSVTVRSRERTVLSGVGFELHRGEVLGLAGLMDSGRSELLRFLFGELESEYDGEIVFDSEVLVPRSAAESIGKRIFYLPGDRKVDGIFAGLDLVRNSTISVLSEFSRLGLLEKRKEAGAVAEMLSSLHVKMHSLAQPVETLSGGNQQKILLARGLMNDPALLLMEEPTRGIDVGAKEEIHALIAQLRAKGMSFIISSSDMPELLQVCDRVLVLYNGAPTAIVDARETTARELLHYAFNEETDEHDA